MSEVFAVLAYYSVAWVVFQGVLRFNDRIHQLIRVAYRNSADILPRHTRQNTLFGYISLSPAFVPIPGLLSPASIHNLPLQAIYRMVQLFGELTGRS